MSENPSSSFILEDSCLVCASMNVIQTEIPEVLIIEPKVFADARGFFFESFNRQTFTAQTGVELEFVQDNHSRSTQNILRGLHYQIQHPQGKLVRVGVGEVFDVAVDIRKSSPTFGKWVGCRLSAENFRQLWIPPGFAHGFLALSETAEVLYKATDYYAPQYDRCILWSDPDIGIDWPLEGATPMLSAKDQAGKSLKTADLFES